MSTGEDVVVTVHALERMELRFPEVIKDMDDQAAGELIYREVMDALDAGRRAKVPPLALAPRAADRWTPNRTKGNFCVWIEDKTRGYVVQDSPEEGLLVITVLCGDPERVRHPSRGPGPRT